MPYQELEWNPANTIPFLEKVLGMRVHLDVKAPDRLERESIPLQVFLAEVSPYISNVPLIHHNIVKVKDILLPVLKNLLVDHGGGDKKWTFDLPYSQLSGKLALIMTSPTGRIHTLPIACTLTGDKNPYAYDH